MMVSQVMIPIMVKVETAEFAGGQHGPTLPIRPRRRLATLGRNLAGHSASPARRPAGPRRIVPPTPPGSALCEETQAVVPALPL